MARPRKYETAEELEAKIGEYFETGVKFRDVIVGDSRNRQIVQMKVPTITGLVLFLGFADRRTFYDLEAVDEFSHTIKKARTRIENEYEEQLCVNGGSGPIFALKNFGWHDKQEVEQSGHLVSEIVVRHVKPDA